MITALDFKNLSNNFIIAKPFEHIVIDDFLQKRFADELIDGFPGPDDVSWWSYDNQLERKLAYDKIENLPKQFSNFFRFVNGEKFLDHLRDLTGIQGLISDPSLRGGGLHLILRNGKLDIHEDFNFHRSMNAYRRVNLIYYLNKDWNESWGGNLELWNRNMTACEASIVPFHNRAVIFRTDRDSNHGHPSPLLCPEGRGRKSLAVYYYEPIPDGENPEYRSTIYKKRPGDSDEFDHLREMRKLGRIEDKVRSRS